MTAIVVAVLVIGLPLLAFALWPLLRRGPGGRAFLALPVDPRQQLEEEKLTVLRALRELEFEHDAGHVSDDDFASLRARHEREAAAILPYEQVAVVDVTNGARLETYTIAGEPGSGEVCINGAAAHLVKPGDTVIIASYVQVDDAACRGWKGARVFVRNLRAFVVLLEARLVAVDGLYPLCVGQPLREALQRDRALLRFAQDRFFLLSHARPLR